MERWIIYALLSMIFAGITSVMAKYGMKNISGDTALTIRTSLIFSLVWLNAIVFKHVEQLNLLTRKDILFLCISGFTTFLSWICYYRAMKDGNVSIVAGINKGSIVITMLLSFLLLKEPFTWQTITAGALITTGLILLIYK